MRRKRNFIGDIKNLHKRITEEIIALMYEKGTYSVQVKGDVMIPFKTGHGYIKAKVNKVCWDKDWRELRLNVFSGIPTEVSSNDFNRLVPCNGLEKVYEEVYDALSFNQLDF